MVEHGEGHALKRFHLCAKCVGNPPNTINCKWKKQFSLYYFHEYYVDATAASLI